MMARYSRVLLVVAAATAILVGFAAAARGNATTSVIDTIGTVPLDTHFSVWASGGASITPTRGSGVTFTVTEPVKLTEVGAFVNNCGEFAAGVANCPDRQPFVIEFRVVYENMFLSTLPTATVTLSDDGDPYLISYESAHPNLILGPSPQGPIKYAAVIRPQGDNTGWVLGSATSPFEYQSAATEVGILDPEAGLGSYLSTQYVGTRILAETPNLREQTAYLLEVVRSFGLGPGTSLTDKLNEAISALDSGDKSEACGSLNAFARESKAQATQTLKPYLADYYQATATGIATSLCG